MSGINSIGAADRGLVRAFNDFGFRLFSRLVEREPNSNVIISPLGVVAALAVLYEGAAGATKLALAKTLSLKRTGMAGFRANYAALRAAFAKPSAGSELRAASALWARQGLELRPEFIQIALPHFETEINNLDFASDAAPRIINDWVKRATRGRIEEMFGHGELSADMALLLMSAVYFKGIWKTQFDRALTSDDKFTLPDGSAETYPMMFQRGTYNYCQTSAVRAVELPYREESTSMLIFLPDGESSPGDFGRTLNGTKWLRWLSHFRLTGGTVRIPRFKVNYEATLNEALRALGTALVFSPDADFRNLCDAPAFVSEVKHKAAIEVTEEGAQAAAATSVTLGRSLSSGFDLVVDRPFLCVITENITGIILFIGLIARP